MKSRRSGEIHVAPMSLKPLVGVSQRFCIHGGTQHRRRAPDRSPETNPFPVIYDSRETHFVKTLILLVSSGE